MTSLSFFGVSTNLEQPGGRIPNTESAKVMFSVIVTFCLKETENTAMAYCTAMTSLQGKDERKQTNPGQF